MADEFGNNHFGAAPSISWCDVTGSKSFSQFGMHIQLFAVTEASGAVGLFVHT